MSERRSEKKPLTFREKCRIIAVTALFAAMGAVLGVVAYSRGWLG